jgi:hypothetical protein
MSSSELIALEILDLIYDYFYSKSKDISSDQVLEMC